MNMREMHEYVHELINKDVVNVKMDLVTSIYSPADDVSQLQMSVGLAVMGLDHDLRYYDFSLKSGPVAWDDDHEIKEMLKHMVIYMTRKMGIRIVQGEVAL